MRRRRSGVMTKRRRGEEGSRGETAECQLHTLFCWVGGYVTPSFMSFVLLSREGLGRLVMLLMLLLLLLLAAKEEP
jgi:hypothetical protein